MSCSELQRRDLDLLLDDVCALTPLRQMDQSVYLSHELIASYLYIQHTNGELHQETISTSTLTIFTTDFPIQNDFTTTIRTKCHRTIEFLMLFLGMMTPQSKSKYMIQYSFESMFMYHILQK